MRYPYRVVVDDNVDRLQVYSRWRHSRAILITRTFTLSGDYFHWLSVVVKQSLRSIGIKKLKGVYGKGDPPLPIPNREVKPFSADGTADRWESRKMPNLDGESYRDVTLSFCVLLSLVSSYLILSYLVLSCLVLSCVRVVFSFLWCGALVFLFLCFLLLFSVFCCFLRGFAFFSLLYSLLHSLLFALSVALFLRYSILSFVLFSFCSFSALLWFFAVCLPCLFLLAWSFFLFVYILFLCLYLCLLDTVWLLAFKLVLLWY